MKLHQPSAAIYVPDGQPMLEAIARTTHLGIGAHQDDLEFMALHGILACYDRTDQWFGGVTCTNGAGCVRIGPYAGYSNEQMMTLRRVEQNAAAKIGRYGFMAQLDHPSAVVKDATDTWLVDDLTALLAAARPDVVYTHNPADKHETHLSVSVAVIEAIRRLPKETRPKQIFGCEGWRDLDWLMDTDRVVLDVGGHDALAAELNAQFTSQITGGKRYDLAVDGRRRAHATFADSHDPDTLQKACFAIDLTPLAQDDRLDIVTFTLALIDRFRSDAEMKLRKRVGT